VEDVVERRLKLSAAADDASAPAGWNDVVDLVWTELRSPAFAVLLELWVAARTDDDLRESLVPMQERIYDTVHRSVIRLVGPSHHRAPILVQFTINLLTGAHLAGILRSRSGTSSVVEAWKHALRELAPQPRRLHATAAEPRATNTRVSTTHVTATVPAPSSPASRKP
jgi:hypothetical protein